MFYKAFNAMCETQYNIWVKILHLDRREEYMSTEFQSYFKSQGTKQKLTVYDTPQHNGIAECRNHTIVEYVCTVLLSQTSFSHISTNSLMILMVLMATESPWKDLSINTSHVSKRSVLAEILGRSTGNYYGTVY